MRKYSGAKMMMAFLALFILLLFVSPAVISASEQQNVILIGWDGCRREALKELIAKNEVPNLIALIKEGRMVDINVTSGATDTKAGWSQILTGYAPEITGIYSNGRYQPIPAGLTILEREEKALGVNGVYSAIITGKSVNMDSDEPLKVPYEWWIRHSEASGLLEMFSPKRRIERIGASVVEEGGNKYVAIPGKPYYFTQKIIDLFKNGLGDNERVAKYAMDTIVKQRNRRFLLIINFIEPDNSGHKYGEGSKEYKNGIKLDDKWTGVIMAKLRELGIYDKTLVYVVSDHGFDVGRKTHNNAPTIFCATNDKLVNRNGDRADIAPTILKRLGIDLMKITPPLTGKPLDEPVQHLKH